MHNVLCWLPTSESNTGWLHWSSTAQSSLLEEWLSKFLQWINELGGNIFVLLYFEYSAESGVASYGNRHSFAVVFSGKCCTRHAEECYSWFWECRSHPLLQRGERCYDWPNRRIPFWRVAVQLHKTIRIVQRMKMKRSKCWCPVR